MKLSTAIEQFCVEQICRGNSDRTVHDYRQKLGRFVLFIGDRNVKEITLPDLRSWYLSLAESLLLFNFPRRAAFSKTKTNSLSFVPVD